MSRHVMCIYKVEKREKKTFYNNKNSEIWFNNIITIKFHCKT